MNRRISSAVCLGALIASLVLASCGPEQNPSSSGGTPASESSAVSLAAGAASAPANDVKISVDEAGYGQNVASMGAELAQEFTSVSEITKASPNIAIVIIESRVDEPLTNMPFSVASARVEQVIRGRLTPGESIPVVETGGSVAGRSKLSPGELGQPVDVGLGGVPVMKAGERWLLFLTAETHVGPRQLAYAVSGAFEGKLLLGSDDRIAFTGNPGQLSAREFAVPSAARGHTLGWLVLQIQESLRTNP